MEPAVEPDRRTIRQPHAWVTRYGESLAAIHQRESFNSPGLTAHRRVDNAALELRLLPVDVLLRTAGGSEALRAQQLRCRAVQLAFFARHAVTSSREWK